MWQVEKAMKTAKKTKGKWFEKQNRKEDETKLNKEGDENNDENDKKNCFLKQEKRKLMATTTK